MATRKQVYKGVPIPRTADLIKDIRGILEENRRLGVFGEDDTIDLRLQVHANGNWALHAGDPQYDTDHRGFWGSTSVSRVASYVEINEASDHLVTQVMDAIAEAR